MNKFGMVLGLAAVATLAGCKDPDYRRAGAPAQNEVKNVDTVPAEPVETPAEVKPVKAEPAPVVVESVDKPAPAPVAKPVEPETTVYIVQNGDYLAKISKKFNITVSAIKRVNNMKSDLIRVGQKLKLPGKVEVGEQKAPVVAAKKPAKKVAKTYEGSTREYVVKSGDTLGGIAYGNGINIRQLKSLNNLSKDTLRVGQKLKIPAEKAAKKAPAKSEAKKAVKAAEPMVKASETTAATSEAGKEESGAAEVNAEPNAPAEAANAEVKADAVPAVEPAAATETAPNTVTYAVQSGEELMDVSIRFGVSVAEIRELNNLGENDTLSPGQVLKLPAEASQQ